MAAEIFILIPVYNADRFLPQAIESVLAQTYQDWELLVLDDCSTDYSFSIAVKYAGYDGRIKVERNKTNLGMVGNWNHGISFCQSEYFVKLDADDTWYSLMLERSLNVLKKNPDVGVVFTKYCNTNEQSEIIQGSEVVLPEFARNKSFSCVPIVQLGADKMLSYPILRQGLSIMRSSVFKKVGCYRLLLTPETQAASDTEFYFRVGCYFNIYCIDETYYYYRVHKESISQNDLAMGVSQKKIFEIKSVILDYYRAQGKISPSLWRKYTRQAQFSYLLYLAYEKRKSGSIKLFLMTLARLFFINPLGAGKFYFSRVISKN